MSRDRPLATHGALHTNTCQGDKGGFLVYICVCVCGSRCVCVCVCVCVCYVGEGRGGGGGGLPCGLLSSYFL